MFPSDDDEAASADPSARRAYRAPSPGEETLAVDDYLVEPETRWEVIDGQRVYAAPAGAPHGDKHFKLDYVLAAHLLPGYVGSTDLLTRWDDDNNYATDTSVRRDGVDPATGRRYLEELAFEVANTQRRHELEQRAQTLVGRGVRRVFAVFVKAGEVAEWSRADGAFVPLALDAHIEDACLARPVLVRAVLDAAAADNEVARALIARRNPVIEEYREQSFSDGRKQGFNDGRKHGFSDGRKQGFSDGHKQGSREATARTARSERIRSIKMICDAYKIRLSAAQQQTLTTADLDQLDAIQAALLSAKAWPNE